MPFTDDDLVWLVAQMLGIAAIVTFVAALRAKQLPQPGRNASYYGFKMASLALILFSLVRAVLLASAHGIDKGILFAILAAVLFIPMVGFGASAGLVLLHMCGVKADD